MIVNRWDIFIANCITLSCTLHVQVSVYVNILLTNSHLGWLFVVEFTTTIRHICETPLNLYVDLLLTYSIFCWLFVVEMIKQGRLTTKRSVSMETDLDQITRTLSQLQAWLKSVMTYVDQVLVSHV